MDRAGPWCVSRAGRIEVAVKGWVAYRADPEVEEALRVLAARAGRPRAAIVREAVLHYARELELLERAEGPCSVCGREAGVLLSFQAGVCRLPVCSGCARVLADLREGKRK